MILLSCLLWGSCYACSACASSAANSAAEEAIQQAQQQAAAAQAGAGQAATPTPTPAAGGGGGGVCGRAGDCCTAYVDAITNAQGNIAAQAMAGSIEQVRSVCGNYAQLGASGAAAEPGCQSAIDGYRTGLTAIGVAVPAACQ